MADAPGREPGGVTPVRVRVPPSAPTPSGWIAQTGLLSRVAFGYIDQMKRCCRCHRDKPLREFNRLTKSRDGLQPACRDCQRVWYEANRASHIANVRRRQLDQNRQFQLFIWGYLLKHPCVDCGEDDPVVLEFDHVRGRKVANISQMNGYSRKAVLAEIAKCVVRCANCHRRKTARERGHYAFVAQLDRASAF